MTSTVTFETIRTDDAFAALQSEWDALVRAMPRPSPFLLHGWLLEWWRHFGEGRDLAVRIARRDGALVGALPLFVGRHRGARVAEFLGAHESALADMLLAPTEDAVAGSLLDGVVDTGQWDIADLFGLPGESRLVEALTTRGTPLRLVRRAEAPVLELGDGWEATYSRKTSGKRRNLHRRRRRQLAELGDLRTECAREPSDLAAALEDAFTLHELRWRGLPDLSSFGTDTGRRFHRAALRVLAEADIPRIVTLKLEGTAVAFHYFMVLEGRMYVHRLAYHPDYARLSPGLVNTLDAIEAAAAEGVQQVEFLGGTERYKVELADRMDPLYEGIGLARGVRGRAALAARVMSLEGRNRLKRSALARRIYYARFPRLRRRDAT